VKTKLGFEDHYAICPYCNKGLGLKTKPTITLKSAASRERERKLTNLGALIKGTSYPTVADIFPKNNNKGASTFDFSYYKRNQGPIEKAVKLRALGKMIRGL
jgi:hypothetical protein